MANTKVSKHTTMLMLNRKCSYYSDAICYRQYTSAVLFLQIQLYLCYNQCVG